jgi:hypothetical protein
MRGIFPGLSAVALVLLFALLANPAGGHGDRSRAEGAPDPGWKGFQLNTTKIFKK